MAIHPRTDKPWTFGIHQCSHHRNWTNEEKNLFREIGHRLGDALISLLFLRDLRNRVADLREAQRIAHIGNWSHTISDNKIQCSDEMFKIMGIAHQDVSHELARKCIHPDDYETYRDLLRSAKAGITNNEIDFRIVRPDGSVRYVHEHWNSERDENDKKFRRFGKF
jgi:PAS domain-containing protein